MGLTLLKLPRRSNITKEINITSKFLGKLTYDINNSNILTKDILKLFLLLCLLFFRCSSATEERAYLKTRPPFQPRQTTMQRAPQGSDHHMDVEWCHYYGLSKHCHQWRHVID